jgi:hypothetical protein
MNARRFAPAIMVTFCVLAGGLALAVAPAFAEKIYYPGGSIGAPGSGPGQFEEPVGVAVNDETDDVYVVDRGNDRVEYFTSTGVFEGQFNGSDAPTGRFSAPEQVSVDNSGSALDPSAGDVYVIDTGHNVIDKFSATGEYLGQLTEREECEQRELPPCTNSKMIDVPFKELRGVAVDPSGNLWVYGGVEAEFGGPYVAEFSDTGGFVQWFRTKENPYSTHTLAVESKEGPDEVYVGHGLPKSVSKYVEAVNKTTSNDGFKELDEEFTEGVEALTIVPSTSTLLHGDLLADKGGTIALYTPITEEKQKPLETFPGKDVPKSFAGFADSSGLAVSPEAVVFASERGVDKVQSFEYVSVPVVSTETPTEVTETGLVLHGNVNPEGEEIKQCFFEYGTEVGKYTSEVSCELAPGQNLSGEHKPVQVSAVVSGLQPAEVRSFRLIVVSGAGVEGSGGGLTVSRPVITGEAVSEVGSSTAQVSAVIDTGGLETCYRFEDPTGGPTPEKKCISAGGESIGVSVEVSGLQPAKPSYFSVIASNALGQKISEDFVFTTFAPSAGELPDGRVDEAVSVVGVGDNTEVYVPQGMKGALDDLGRHGIYTNLPFEAAANGETVTYIGDPPTKGGNGDDGVGGGNQYVARRGAGGGWTQVSVNASGYENDYAEFSGNLSAGVIGSPEQLTEGVPEGYHNLYVRSIGWRSTAEGSFEPQLEPFEPLITATPCVATEEFGSLLDNQLFHEPLVVGGNAGAGGVTAFSHLLFEADVRLPSEPVPLKENECRAGNDLYDWVGGRLYLVNVLPNGEVEGSATFGRQGPSRDGSLSPEVSGAISGNGSRIYWSAVKAVAVGGEYEEQPKALYVRENDTQPESEVEGGHCTEPAMACTVQVDAAEPGCVEPECVGGGGEFWAASEDGAEVFFTDERRLTKDSTAGLGEPDLYEYDLEAPEGERLSDLSLPAEHEPGVHADVQGVVGTSSDGAYVYFVADGVLAEGAAPGNCNGSDEAGQTCSLYVRHDGATRFIATLSGQDGDFTHGEGGNDGDWQADPGHRTAEVTPDGGSVVFMSRLPLTGYDNRLEGTPLTEVFVYDAESGRLMCASCNPSGEAPVAPTLPEFASDIAGIWGSFLPVSDSHADYQPRVISGDGSRVFFDSVEPLVPQDKNGLLDVYEWEREGSGSCREAQSREAGGCVFSISGGQSSDNSYLIDASASGDDVFFVSRAQLVSADHGDDDVLYDARVGGVKPLAEVECSGTGCQGAPPAAPIFATPASVTFEGVGDYPEEPPPPAPLPTRCSRGKKLSHGKCVMAPRSVTCRKGRKLRRGKCVKKAKAKTVTKGARHRRGPKNVRGSGR